MKKGEVEVSGAAREHWVPLNTDPTEENVRDLRERHPDYEFEIRPASKENPLLAANIVYTRKKSAS